MSAPPVEVLDAFGARGEPVLLAGGMGRTWRVGDIVLKPVEDVVEHAWVAEVYDAWPDSDVRVPRPLRAHGAWAFAGWGAHLWVPGETARAGDDPVWFRAAHESFHDAVADVARPAFLDDRDDAWSYGDRVAWEGATPWGDHDTRDQIERALGRLEPVDLPSQVVHGDLGGNVLRDGDRAGIIDWPAYHRPRAWALAVVATDAICWEGADPSLLDRWADDPAWPQLLLRAIVYRLATRGHNQATGSRPVGSDGYVAQGGRMLRLVEERL
ncbi:MAG TPA: TIGR02569 family protein [Nocardioides sp.]|nr:TIGR02569 family protein [Nocardioides sp.]